MNAWAREKRVARPLRSPDMSAWVRQTLGGVHGFFLATYRVIRGGEVVIQIHTGDRFFDTLGIFPREVPDMSHRGHDCIVGPEISVDGPGLGRRFHDHELLSPSVEGGFSFLFRFLRLFFRHFLRYSNPLRTDKELSRELFDKSLELHLRQNTQHSGRRDSSLTDDMIDMHGVVPQQGRHAGFFRIQCRT